MDGADATVERDGAGDEPREADSGDEDRCSRVFEERTEESRNFDGIFDWEADKDKE